MTTSRLPAFAAGVICTLVLGGGGAAAATGGKFILGKSNSASSTTTLVNKNGTPLALKAGGGAAPLSVNSGARVTNLNADKVDGLSASDFARASGKTGAYDFTGELMDSDENGVDDTIVAFAYCPPGTQMTGGGGIDFSSTGITFYNSPDLDESWAYAVFIDESVREDPKSVTASIVCYSPDGSGLAGSYRTARSTMSSGTMAKIKAAAAAKLDN